MRNFYCICTEGFVVFPDLSHEISPLNWLDFPPWSHSHHSEQEKSKKGNHPHKGARQPQVHNVLFEFCPVE